MDIHNIGVDPGSCGLPVIPGIQTELYVVCACDIETMPEVPAYDVADPGAHVTLPGNIVLTAGNFWAKFRIVTDKGFVTDELIGEIGSKSYKNMLNISIAGTEADTLAWHQITSNGCLVFVVREKSGNFRVIGSKEIPAHYDSNVITNGPEVSGSNGVLVANTGRVAPIYTGTLPTE